MPRTISAFLAVLLVTPLLAQTEGTCLGTGGKAAVESLLEQELMYPAVALEAGIKGDVVVSARLDPSGRVLALGIARSLSPECDREALRVARQVVWRPATAGEACAGHEHYLTVPFDPARYKRWLKGRHPRSADVFSLPADTSVVVHMAKDMDRMVEPDIPNGMSGLPAFLGRELRYPNEAFRYSLEGTVKLEFVVEPSGTISNMRALQDVGGGCTDEAIRLMHRIAWLPGTIAGTRVRGIQQVSIRFDLPKEGR